MKTQVIDEGIRFQMLRHTTGLSQTQFARKCDEHPQNISRIEQGYSSLAYLTYAKVVNISKVFDVPPAKLLEYVVDGIVSETIEKILIQKEKNDNE